MALRSTNIGDLTRNAHATLKNAWKDSTGDSVPSKAPAPATSVQTPTAAPTAALRTDAITGGTARVTAASRSLFHAATGRVVR